jgi:hypothetical protein
MECAMNDLFKRFLELIDYAPNDVFVHQWKSYNGATVLGHTNMHGYASIAIDFKSNTVIELRTSPEQGEFIEYSWLNPEYRMAVAKDADKHCPDHKTVSLEVIDDYFEKAFCILNNQPVDQRIMLELNLNERELFEAMKAAHNADMSFNSYIELGLSTLIDKEKISNE